MYSLTMDLKQDKEEYAQQSIIRNATPIMEAAQLYKKGEIDNAEKLLDQLLKIGPNDYNSRMLLTEIFHEQCIKNDTLCEYARFQLDFFNNKISKKDKTA